MKQNVTKCCYGDHVLQIRDSTIFCHLNGFGTDFAPQVSWFLFNLPSNDQEKEKLRGQQVSSNWSSYMIVGLLEVRSGLEGDADLIERK